MRQNRGSQRRGVTPELRRRIEAALRDWENPDSEARKRFDALRGERQRQLKHLHDQIERSTRLTAEDFAVTINTI